ncbi:unnamed protein product [Candidula unifasciata]|uniref:UNC93-like protein n=1 Tax=Candidula unifasciata TaxID=100452 RepID=A0A8S3ZA29_9EUPU|nr:unnamed protein product [Candidula unifasciata]
MVDLPPVCEHDLMETQPAVSDNDQHCPLSVQRQQCESADTDTVSDHSQLSDTQDLSCKETDSVSEVLTCSPSFTNGNGEIGRQYSSVPGRDDHQTDEDSCQQDIVSKIFNNTYTDTVSSVASTTFLIKPSDQEQDSAVDYEDVTEIYFNCGYTDLPKRNIDRGEQGSHKISAKRNASFDVINGESSDRTEEKEPEQSENIRHSENPFQNIEEFVHQYLIPATESEVLSFDIQEITPSAGLLLEPTEYRDVTRQLLEINESFLFGSQSSVYDQDKTTQNKRAVTMQNLHERSSFVNLTNIEKMSRVCQRALVYLKDDLTFGSLASLSNIAAKQCTNPAQEVHFINNGHTVDVIGSTKHRRNVIALSISITLLFIAMGSVRNLQSSLNQEGGIGIISMAVSFVGYMLGSIVSSSIVQNFQPRKCIVVSLIPNLIYVAANIYPVLWLMTVISFIQGISLAIIWNAMSTYITFLSRGYAAKKNQDFDKVSCNFFGTFCLIYQSYHIIGNLIASLVLMPSTVTTLMNSTFQNITANKTTSSSSLDTLLEDFAAPVPVVFQIESVSEMSQNGNLWDSTHLNLCGAAFCNHFEVNGSMVSVSTSTKYLLFGIYMGCIALSMLVAAFVLEPLNHRLFQSTVSPAKKLKRQLVSLAHFSIDSRFLLLLPMLMYSIMQFGFISGEVTMAFVTCPLGIHMVGYIMICFGITASMCSYISGILCKYTGRVSQIITASVLNLAVLVFMTYWQPTSGSLIPYFCVIGLWGVGDGVWNCQVNSIMGVVFSDKFEEAYSGLRVAQGLGVAILFSYSNLVCMTVKIYIIAGVCVVSLVCYLTMELVVKYRIPHKQTLIKQTSV